MPISTGTAEHQRSKWAIIIIIIIMPGFKRSMVMLSMLNSTEMAGIDHGSDKGMYLDTGQKTMDESDGAKDHIDRLSKHRNVHGIIHKQLKALQ